MELALVLPMFVSLVLVTVDASRWVFGLAAAGEAAREGARSAAVCGPEADAAVRRRMAPWLEGVTGGNVSVQRLPAGCYANSASGSPVCNSSTRRAQYSCSASEPSHQDFWASSMRLMSACSMMRI